MIIHNIKIRDFKSLYGEHEFDFDKCTGLIKLSGPIGVGKTSLGEAIIYGLLGTIKKQNNTDLIAWNCKTCEVEINITSKNKEIYIKRSIYEPLFVKINDVILPSSNKRGTQQILEEEIYDVPKLAITKMCIISFNQFSSLASMNPGETKIFLDDIFNFKLFTEYNDEIIIEKKNEQNELIKLNAIKNDYEKQIQNLDNKKNKQSKSIEDSFDIESLKENRKSFVQEGINIKEEFEKDQKQYNTDYNNLTKKMTETSTLGKQEKNFYNTFKSGICPTCGQQIDERHIEEHHKKMLEYADIYNKISKEQEQLKESNKPKIDEYNSKIKEIKSKIENIDSDIKIYKNKIQTINDNYDDLIQEYQDKLIIVNDKISKCNIEIEEWSDMSDLFSKSLRYKLLDTLIPHINKSIQYFINKLDQMYRISFDQEFKCHIYVESFSHEISYNNLSTGQKKSLDLAIIFGILENIIANVDFNILFLDELFSNMDADTRNIMLNLLKESVAKNKTCFIINHSEMSDDVFNHKIRVSLQNKHMTIKIKKEEQDVIVKASKYEQIF